MFARKANYQKLLFIFGAACLALSACKPGNAVPAEEVVRNLDKHVGKRVLMRGKFKSGARCRLETPDGEWKTYCKNCQFCRGPLVVDTGVDLADEGIADWPLVLGGTAKHKGKVVDIRCKGPLNKIECAPFELGKTYIVRGRIEKNKPPKLMVSEYWED